VPSLVRLRVPLGFVVGLLFVWMARPTLWSLMVGAPLVVLGELVRLFASGRIDKNRRLATSGPYAHVRHPLYVGSALITAGFAISSARLPLALALIATFGLVYGAVSRREEETLAARFGVAFERWRREVPAYLPRITPYRGGEPQPFSWSAVRRHRELRTVAGVLAVLAFLVWRVAVAA